MSSVLDIATDRLPVVGEARRDARLAPDVPSVARDDRLQIVYIAGASFCGSTLLAFLFNSHPEILSIGEMGPAPKFEAGGFECSCETPLARCPFFSQVKEIMDQRGVGLDLANLGLRHEYGKSRFGRRLLQESLYLPFLTNLRDIVRERLPGIRRQIDGFKRRNEAFMRAALEVAQKRIFLDATKLPVRIPFLARMNAALKVVHLVRDPRGFSYSSLKHQKRTVDVSARVWVRAHSKVERYLRALPRDRWVRVRYEAICANPEEELSRLTEFMGAGPFTLPDDFRDQAHHIVGNKMRTSADPRRTIQLDEKWRTMLSAEEQRVVARIAGPLARRYRYEIEGGRRKAISLALLG